MKLQWKQLTSCGKIICGVCIMSTDCTGSSKIKRRNILQPNSLSINTVICSSLHPHNLDPSSGCGKLKNEKKKKRWRNEVQFRVLHLTQERNNRTQKDTARNKDADLVRQQRLQSCVLYTCVCACVRAFKREEKMEWHVPKQQNKNRYVYMSHVTQISHFSHYFQEP